MKATQARTMSNQPRGRRSTHEILTALTQSGRRFGALALLSLVAGCATHSKVAKTEYFFPPPPDQPRLQYLTSFASEKEFRGGEEKTLMGYLTGVKPPQKNLGKPYGIAVAEKKIYICDTELGAVVVADMSTRHFGVIEAEGEGAMKMPLNLDVDATDGACYVADAGRNQVVVFDKNGKYLSAIGKEGEMKPRDVLVKPDRIYIADLQTHHVRVLDKTTRNLLFTIPPAEDTNKVHGLFTPTNLAMDSKGNLYVSDTGAFRIQVYDANGKFLRAIGEMGDSLGQFARVKGIAIDRDDRLYAVDAMAQVVQIFNDQGKLLTWFGEPTTDNKLQNLPAKIALDYDDVGYFEKFASPKFKVEHLVIVINQLGSHMVSVYGFGHKK